MLKTCRRGCGSVSFYMDPDTIFVFQFPDHKIFNNKKRKPNSAPDLCGSAVWVLKKAEIKPVPEKSRLSWKSKSNDKNIHNMLLSFFSFFRFVINLWKIHLISLWKIFLLTFNPLDMSSVSHLLSRVFCLLSLLKSDDLLRPFTVYFF